MSGRTYRDATGRPCSLTQLCIREPEWAASRILDLEHQLVRAAREQPPVPVQLVGDGVDQFGWLLADLYAQGHAAGHADGLVDGALAEPPVEHRCGTCEWLAHECDAEWCCKSGNELPLNLGTTCDDWEERP